MTTSSLFKRTTLACGLALLAPLAAWSQVSLSITVAPPALPLYAQPPIPGDGYLWTPGYWAWDPGSGEYYWVPGTWVQPPEPGFLWTPGYWGFIGGVYSWHHGYWGNHVGYYGGLNYGYGYTGSGYSGGRWDHGHLRYNNAVNNLPPGRVHDVYHAAVPSRPAAREGYTGGPSHYRGPSAGERRVEADRHGDPTPEQAEHEHRAMGIPDQRMSNAHGAPFTAATPRPGGFGEPGAEHVRAAPEMHGPQGGARPQGAPQARPQGHPGGGGGGHEEHH